VAVSHKKFGKSWAGGLGCLGQQALEAFLLEICVCGERCGKSPLPHQNEADGVAQGVAGAYSRFKKD
jgi:hypothetical protein